MRNTHMDDEFLAIAKEVSGDEGRSAEMLRLLEAVAGKPDPMTAWDNLMAFHSQFTKRYDMMTNRIEDEDDHDAALNAVDACERMLMSKAAPHVQAMLWKLDVMSHDLRTGSLHVTASAEFEILKADVYRFAVAPEASSFPS